MQYSKFDIVFYETEDGRFPAAEFIKSQDSKMRAKIYRTLELLEDNGTALRMPIRNTWMTEFFSSARR